MSHEQGFLPAVIKGEIKEKGEHDMLFISALELVQMCQKHGILIGTDCVIHFCDEQGTWHEMLLCCWLHHIKTLFTIKKCCEHKAFCKQK